MTIAITAIIAGLVQALLHWFPWSQLLGKPLSRIPSYALGTAGIAVPYTSWLLLDGRTQEAMALWVVVLVCGIVVALAYLVDSLTANRIRAQIAEQAERLMKDEQDAA